MGLFTEVKDYGGQLIFEFNQGTHPFIENQQRRLIGSGNGAKARLIDNGVCCGISFNWLEFQHTTPETAYSVDGLDEQSIGRIIEMQVAVRKNNSPLHEVLATFGPKIKKENEAESDEATLMKLLLEPGIKTIAFQSKEKSHVAVAHVVRNGENIIFKLFDAARGEINFILPVDFKPSEEKNPYSWLQSYFQAYQRVYSGAVNISIDAFTDHWVKKETSDQLHEAIRQQNTPKAVEVKVSTTRYGMFSKTADAPRHPAPAAPKLQITR
ncbi:MAG: hypothetical protein JSR33_01045 [Proteobacteria bacterium]|nr:hypothetical protein [Pseudomonadota bacterium]